MLKRAICAVAVAIALCATVLTTPPAATAASYGWTYLVFPKWLGNCPTGNVAAVQASVDNLWSTNWDYGDDIVYGKVRLNSRNTVSYNLMCKLGSRIVGYQPYTVSIHPTRNRQTVWMGPSGVRYN